MQLWQMFLEALGLGIFVFGIGIFTLIVSAFF